MNDAICLTCGYKDNINSFIINAADEDDPNPTITCPICGEAAEAID